MELIDEAQLFAANAGSIATVQLLAMFPVDDDLALKATFKQADRLQHRRFARTRQPDQRDDLARLQGEVDPEQHIDRRDIGRAHVSTPLPNAHLVCRLLLEKKN